MVSRNRYLISAVMLALYAAAAVFISTSHGVAIQPDSNAYQYNGVIFFDILRGTTPDNAETIQLYTHFPPFYSIILQLFQSFGVSTGNAARSLDILLFPLSGLLIAGIAYFLTDSLLAALVGFALYVLAPSALDLYTYQLSEPLFITLCLGTLFLFLHYAQRRNVLTLLGFSLLTSLAFYTRFAGVFLIPVGLGVIWFINLERNSKAQRLRDSIVFLVIASAALASWVLTNFIVFKHGMDRLMSLHPPGLALLTQGIGALTSMIVPIEISFRIALPLAIIAALFIGWGVFRLLTAEKSAVNVVDQRQRMFFWVAQIYLLSYLAMLLIVIIFFDASTPMDYRLLSPLHPLLLIVALVVLSRLPTRLPSIRPAFVNVFFAIVIAVCAVGSVQFINNANQNGVGYLTVAWLNSQLVTYVENNIPNDTPIYSNKHEQFQILLKRNVDIVPSHLVNLRTNGEYDSELKAMIDSLTASRGYLILYTKLSDQERQQDNIDYLVSLPVLVKIASFDDGLVFQVKSD